MEKNRPKKHDRIEECTLSEHGGKKLYAKQINKFFLQFPSSNVFPWRFKFSLYCTGENGSVGKSTCVNRKI